MRFLITLLPLFLFCSGNCLAANIAVRPLEEYPQSEVLCEAVERYAEGEGTPEGFVKAFPVFKALAEQGDPVAQYYMGHACQYAHGTSLDYEQAWHWYEKALNQGVREAYGRMGYMWEKGLGRPKNINKAAADYRKAPPTDILAKCLLARMIIQNEIEGSEESAVRDLEAGVSAEIPFAMQWLGLFHCVDSIQNPNPKYGKQLLERGMELGYSPAAFYLAGLATGHTPYFPEDDQLWKEIIENFRKLTRAEAAKMTEEAVFAYKQAGIDAGIKKLDDKASIWMKTHWSGSWDFFIGAAWTEAQVKTGRTDPEWSLRVFQWIYDRGERIYEEYDYGYYFSPITLDNIRKELVETGRIAELDKLAQTASKCLKEWALMDTDLGPRNDLNQGTPKLPRFERFRPVLTYQPENQHVDPKVIGQPISYSSFCALNVLTSSEFYKGDWRDSLGYIEWTQRWLKVRKAAGIEKASSPADVWDIEANSAENSGRIWTTLGFFKWALNAYQTPIDSNQSGYGGRSVHVSKTQKALLQTETSAELEYGLEELRELREDRAANEYDTKRAPYEVDLAIAATLRRKGESDAAYALLGETISRTNEVRLIIVQIEGLRMRARWALEDERLEQCEDDLVTVLHLCRSKGLKIKEPELYHLYARYQAATGKYDAAIEFQLQAIDLYQSLDLYTWLPLRYIELSEWYRIIGNDDLADYYLNLVRSLLNQPGAEYPGWIVEAVRQRIALQNEAKLRNETAHKEPKLPDSDPTDGALETAEGSVVDLQPSRLVAIPLESKPALGLYTLTNFSDSAQWVTLVARGQVGSFNTNELGDYVVRLDGAIEATEVNTEIELSAQEQRLIYVHAPANAAPLHMQLALIESGQLAQTVSFSFPESEGLDEEAVINASYVENNPFYMVSIHHVLQRLETEKAMAQNLRFIASEPARIEGYDGDGRLMFVDADGDGAFNSPGDILRSDVDANSAVDVSFAAGEDSTSLELKVLPRQRPLSGQLEVEIHRLSDQSWQSDAVDVIRFSE